MTDYSLNHTGAKAGHSLQNMMPSCIILSCILFNFFLCFLNTKVMPVTPAIIILCEIILVAAAVATGFLRIDRIKFYWIVILGLQILLISLLSVFKGEFLMKPLRDVMIMPVFIILGLSAYRLNFSKVLLGFGILITLVAFWEAFLTENFLSLFNIRDYYVSKGAMPGDVTITELAVFASGERPDGRFLFAIPGIHRISSVFLEPISLGFYGAIAGIYFIAAKDGISKKLYIAGLFVSFLLIWLSDARMAFGTLVLLLLLRPIFAKIDHRFALLLIPFTLLVSYVFYNAGIFEASGEGIGARLHMTMELLSHTTLEILLGVSSYGSMTTADSGLAYILNAQGLLGLLLFWLPPVLFFKRLPEPARIYLFGISLFFSFGMVLSPGFFTIKTAALLWFCYGYLIARNLKAPDGHYHYPA